MSSLAETAAPLRLDDERIALLREIRRRLESRIHSKFDPALSLLIDEIVQMEESVAGEESEP